MIPRVAAQIAEAGPCGVRSRCSAARPTPIAAAARLKLHPWRSRSSASIRRGGRQGGAGLAHFRCPRTPGKGRECTGESGERAYGVMSLARTSSSHPAAMRFCRREVFPGAKRIRFCAICLMVQKLAGA